MEARNRQDIHGGQGIQINDPQAPVIVVQSGASSESEVLPFYDIPYRSSPNFVGRTIELVRLDEIFEVSDRAVISAVAGMGGVGKRHWLPDGWVLVVLDDVIDWAKVRSLMPTDDRFRVLVTTRRQDLLPKQVTIPLDVLEPEAGTIAHSANSAIVPASLKSDFKVRFCRSQYIFQTECEIFRRLYNSPQIKD